MRITTMKKLTTTKIHSVHHRMFQKLSQKSMNSYLLKDAGRGIAARGVGLTLSTHKTGNAGAHRWATDGVENHSPRE